MNKHRINETLGAAFWAYNAGVSLGIYQKMGNNPATMAKCAVALEKNEDGSFSLLLNEDVLKQLGIKTKTVSMGQIQGYIKPQIIVTNIEWDMDEDQEAELPKATVIDITPKTKHLLEDIDGYSEALSDYLSDTYGYCVKGYSVSVEGVPHIKNKKKGA